MPSLARLDIIKEACGFQAADAAILTDWVLMIEKKSRNTIFRMLLPKAPLTVLLNMSQFARIVVIGDYGRIVVKGLPVQDKMNIFYIQ